MLRREYMSSEIDCKTEIFSETFGNHVILEHDSKSQIVNCIIYQIVGPNTNM